MPEPYCLAMVLCDAVHRDVGSGKFTLLGTFSVVQAVTFPASFRFTIYLAVTDGANDVDIRLRVVDAGQDFDDQSEPVWETKTTSLNFPNPLAVIEGVFGVELELPRPGMYHCEAFANDDLLMSRRLAAIQISGPGVSDA